MKGTDNTSFAHVLEQTLSKECVLVIFGGGTGSTSPSKLNIHPLSQLAQTVVPKNSPALSAGETSRSCHLK
jgi:hypothetical protein